MSLQLGRVRPRHTEDRIDFRVVAEIVRVAGLDCRIDRHPAELLRARPAGGRPGTWTVSAGSCRRADAGALAFVGPAGSTSMRLVRTADERHLAALVVLQALRDNPGEPLSHDEAAACGLAGSLIWD